MTPKEFAAYLIACGKSGEAKLQEVIDKAAATCEAEAKQDCPVDTGNLRGSIHTEKGHLQDDVGTDVEYAAYVEYGTSRQRAQPYMQPGADAAQQQIPQLLKQIDIWK